MATYRIYKLNRDDKIAGPPEVVECCDDADALQQARKLVADFAVEVWEGNRRVGSVSAAD